MSVLNWFKRVTTGDPAADLIEQPVTFGEGEEEFHGLNMREALDAHMRWTQRLEESLRGESEEELEPEIVASDCHCTLGKWLYGPAKQEFGDSADYDELRREHADFHRQAGAILQSVRSGEHDAAQNGLRLLRRQSGVVQLALVRLYSHTRH